MPLGSHGNERRSRRGRPPTEPGRDVRGALLAAAHELFLARAYGEVSLRQLAAAAGVNPAMVRYYFGDKQGLYAAMLQEVVAPLFARVESMLGAPAAQTADLPGLLRDYMRIVAANPWLPSLILRDVLAPDGAFRERFVADFAGRLAPKVAQLASRGPRASGRREFDPRLVVVSMLSLGLWPFLAMPLLERALKFRADAAGIERLIDHSVRFFRAGMTAGAES